jgi:peptidoglycan hydrolase-like protein with peptidoglycan-binding domain
MQKVALCLLASLLWLWPVALQAGESGRDVEQNPEQKHLMTKGDIILLQERLKAEGVDSVPVNGVMDSQTEVALRRYQEKKGLPVSGAADEATLRELQLGIPPVRAGGR